MYLVKISGLEAPYNGTECDKASVRRAIMAWNSLMTKTLYAGISLTKLEEQIKRDVMLFITKLPDSTEEILLSQIFFRCHSYEVDVQGRIFLDEPRSISTYYLNEIN